MGYVTPLDQLGGEIKARVEAADKSLGRAEDLYRSAGVMLIEAKERVLKTKGLTWPGWLRDNARITRSRADELIMIADGRTTLEELRAGYAARNARRAATVKEARDAVLHGKSSAKTQQKQRAHMKQEDTPPEPAEEKVIERNERDVVLDRIVTRLNRAPLEDLILVEKTITTMLGD